MGPLTLAACGLIGAGLAVDLAAKLTRYRHGETVSALIRARRSTRAAAGAALVVLFLHLVLRLF